MRKILTIMPSKAILVYCYYLCINNNRFTRYIATPFIIPYIYSYIWKNITFSSIFIPAKI